MSSLLKLIEAIPPDHTKSLMAIGIFGLLGMVLFYFNDDEK